jgi:hypothetical protein
LTAEAPIPPVPANFAKEAKREESAKKGLFGKIFG